jgi:hypothetical protein
LDKKKKLALIAILFLILFSLFVSAIVFEKQETTMTWNQTKTFSSGIVIAEKTSPTAQPTAQEVKQVKEILND